MSLPLWFIAETPRAGRRHHIFLTAPDCPLGETEITRLIDDARVQTDATMTSGPNYLAIANPVNQTTTGRGGTEILMLVGLDIAKLTKTQRDRLASLLKEKSQALDALVSETDWGTAGELIEKIPAFESWQQALPQDLPLYQPPKERLSVWRIAAAVASTVLVVILLVLMNTQCTPFTKTNGDDKALFPEAKREQYQRFFEFDVFEIDVCLENNGQVPDLKPILDKEGSDYWRKLQEDLEGKGQNDLYLYLYLLVTDQHVEGANHGQRDALVILDSLAELIRCLKPEDQADWLKQFKKLLQVVIDINCEKKSVNTCLKGISSNPFITPCDLRRIDKLRDELDREEFWSEFISSAHCYAEVDPESNDKGDILINFMRHCFKIDADFQDLEAKSNEWERKSTEFINELKKWREISNDNDYVNSYCVD